MQQRNLILKRKLVSQTSTILETGRLSPSSLGLEPWRFVVIENEDLKEKLKPYSWGAQKQSASRFVIILARKNVTADSEYVQHIIRGIKNTKKVRFQQLKINLIISKRISILTIMSERY